MVAGAFQGTTAEYDAYLCSDAWKAKRDEKIRSVFARCEICRARGGALDVHHVTYENFGNEPLSDLQAICRVHHNRIHEIVLKKQVSIREAGEIYRHVWAASQAWKPRKARVSPPAKRKRERIPLISRSESSQHFGPFPEARRTT